MTMALHQKLRRFSFIIISVAASSCVSLIGGLGLEAVLERILPIVPLLIALPGLNTMVGDYAATIAAHAGDPAERTTSKKELARAIAKAVWVNIIGIIVLSTIVAARRGYIFETAFIFKFIGFVIFSMLGIIVFMFVITAALDKLLESNRLNPDDVLIPIVTSITDVMMLGLIALSVWLVF